MPGNMQHSAVILFVVSALVASSLGFPKPGEDGNTSTGETYDEFTSVLDRDRDSEERKLQNHIEEDHQFSDETMREELVRTLRVIPLEQLVFLGFPGSPRAKRAGTRVFPVSVTPDGCTAGFKRQKGKCVRVANVSGRRQSPKPIRV